MQTCKLGNACTNEDLVAKRTPHSRAGDVCAEELKN